MGFAIMMLSAVIGLIMSTPVAQYIVWTYFATEPIRKQIVYVFILNVAIGLIISDVIFDAIVTTMIAILERVL